MLEFRIFEKTNDNIWIIDFLYICIKKSINISLSDGPTTIPIGIEALLYISKGIEKS